MPIKKLICRVLYKKYIPPVEIEVYLIQADINDLTYQSNSLSGLAHL